MPRYTIETPRGNKVTIEADTPEAATQGAQTWDLQDYATKEATRLGLDPGLALRQMHQESRANPAAVSPKGARGPMQLMPDTAKGLGVDPDDPYQNITGGLTYYAKLKKQYNGDDRTALAAYNAGPGNVAKYGGIPPFKETQDYVNTIMGPATPPGPVRGPMNRGAPAPSLDQMRAFAAGNNGMGKDVARSFVGGASKGTAGLGDMVLNASVGPVLSLLQGGANLASGELPGVASPLAALSQKAAQAAHKPLTTAGQWADTLGTMLPGAAMGGGGVLQRLANVILPTIGAEGSAQAVKALGGDEGAQGLARTVGGVAGGLATGVRAPARVPQPQPRTLQQMEAAKNAAYTAVDNLGVTYPRQTVNSMVGGLRTLLQGEGGAEVYPQAGTMLRRIQQSASQGPMTLRTLDKLRSQVGEVVGTSDAERRVAGLIRNHIDTFIDTAQPTAPPGVDAAGAIRNARALNTQFAKMRDITNRMDSGELMASTNNSGGNVNNNIRQKLRPLIDPKSPQRMRNLTPAETAALNTTVRGSVANNTARGLGNVLRNRIVQAALALPTKGASLALEIPGQGLKHIAQAGTQRSVQNLLDLISVGGVRPQPRSMIGYNAQFPAVMGGLPGLTALLAPQASAAREHEARRKPQGR